MLGLDEGGRLDISSKLMSGISIPLMGGRDIPPMLLDIIFDEEDDELETEEDDIIFEEVDFMFILDIILPIISSILKLDIPPMDGMPDIPPIDIVFAGIGPPDDIIVDDDVEEDVDLKLETVDPSSDWVVAAIL